MCREVLQKEDELNEIVQLVGKDSLAEGDKVVLETARLIKDDFLQQNSFTSYDKYCPFYKSVEMMKNMVAFHRLATQAIERTAAGNADGQKITFNLIKSRCAAGPSLQLRHVGHRPLRSRSFITRVNSVSRLCVSAELSHFELSTLALDSAQDGRGGHARGAACRMADVLYKLTSMKFQEPDEGEDAVKAHMTAVRTELTERFRALEEEFR